MADMYTFSYFVNHELSRCHHLKYVECKKKKKTERNPEIAVNCFICNGEKWSHLNFNTCCFGSFGHLVSTKARFIWRNYYSYFGRCILISAHSQKSTKTVCSIE